MNKLLIVFASLLFICTAQAQEIEEFTGDKKLACEAVLCLSTSYSPGECSPSLDRYFSISHKKMSDTISARKDFLDICPASHESQEMRNLVDAIANAAGRCTAQDLNRRFKTISVLQCRNTTSSNSRSSIKNGRRANNTNMDNCVTVQIRVVDNSMPTYCQAYRDHGYTDIQKVKYIGNPANNTGKWVTD